MQIGPYKMFGLGLNPYCSDGLNVTEDGSRGGGGGWGRGAIYHEETPSMKIVGDLCEMT